MSLDIYAGAFGKSGHSVIIMAERNKVLKEIIGAFRGLKNRRQSKKIQKDLVELQKKVRAISTAIRKVKREKKVNDNRQVDDWDPRDFYAIKLKREQKSRKFKMKGQRYGVKFHRLSEKIPPAELPRALPRVMGSLVDDLKKKCGAEDHDYLRLIIHHPSLKSEVWITLGAMRLPASLGYMPKTRRHVWDALESTSTRAEGCRTF